MKIRKIIIYLFQGTLVGLIIGFTAIFLFKQVNQAENTVQFTESSQVSEETNNTYSYASAVKKAAPAVVNIFSSKLIKERTNPFFDDPVFRRFFGNSLKPRVKKQNNLGSGVIINDKGYIITNNHVIKGAQEILVALNDGSSSKATLIGTDQETDLAVLKINLKNLPSIVLGHSKKANVGDIVLAIGNPFGVGQTVTQGIISALGRNQLGITTFENFIQTDAAINPGNSGGALINLNGELIAINTAIFSKSGGSQGIGFAIPVDTVKIIVKQIIEHGATIRGWLGIEVQSLSADLAESFNFEDGSGIIIAGVILNGPAGDAGVRPGDILLSIDGENIKNTRHALNRIANSAPESKINLKIWRQGKELSLDTMVGYRPIPKKK